MDQHGVGSPAESRRHSSKLAYRKDIDGLRAVAVLLVIGDHLKIRVGGGFVGVDVFFVISGYLISAAILKEMANGTFSIVNFYERRIRRIFPALLVMLLASSAAAWFLLFPSELLDFARSLLAALFSVSNLLFWHQAGYFDAPSAFKPLLHTWSLAVEEQFYIFFPVVLILVRRFQPHRLKLWILLLTAATFALAALCVHRDATAAFFFAPLRAWELLLGTIVSQRYLPTLRSALARNLAALTGLLLILVPALRYSSATVFPGLAALPPCLGAALIIAAGETGSSVVGRVLSLRPVVFVGLISYSLYLWHWPVIVFQDIGQILPLPANHRRLKLALLIISLLLGALSWAFVEEPFRKGRLRPARKPLFLMNGAAVALVAFIGLAMLATHGSPGRFPRNALEAADYLTYSHDKAFRSAVCFLDLKDRLADFNQSTCLAQQPGRKSVLLLGDSHAAQLYPGLRAAFPDISIEQATTASHPMLLQPDKDATTNNKELTRFIYFTYLPSHHVDAVLLGGRWSPDQIPAIAASVAYMKQHGIDVFLLGPMIEYNQPYPRVLAMALRDHRLSIVADHRDDSQRTLDRQLAALARDQWHIHYISYFDTLCTPECPLVGTAGVPLLYDEHHFTANGSILFFQKLKQRHELPF